MNREELMDFFEKHRSVLYAILIALGMVLIYMNWLVFVGIFGGLGMMYALHRHLDDDHPLRDAIMVGALLAWAFLCWKGFDWIVKYESRKAKTFCGKIVDDERQSYPRQRPHYIYLLKNQQGQSKSFAGHDYWGDKNSHVCLKYIPHEKSVFFAEDYVLEKTKD
ncbi:hypothetical protein [Alysiella crassa]|uniref:Uncharacterized protein n=1 Tax=Alysiella crassa TaxID=153491 RepID=A0A376BN47_9NEIS|nr:hypothetical protein [Alysiella crassa]UOP06701.1 hypothetical protein LVJ80_13380 [Alysiella crassa]SSY71192.1 Uncharacterised protein [Alysiella crassa]